MKRALLLLAHGSRHESANDDLFHLAEVLRGRGEFDHVEAAFLELAAPDIAEGARRCVVAGAERVIMLPYFLSAGLHFRRDLQAARAAAQSQQPGVTFVLAEPLGRHPLLSEIVLERAKEAETTE